MVKLINCKACGKEMAKDAKNCPSCGAKNKKPFYKQWWVWVIALVLFFAIVSGGGEQENETPATSEVTGESVVADTYEIVDLSVMLDDLKSNAMKAENNYKNKLIEFYAKIKSFDSDGKYISVEPVNADEWNFETAMCYIKNEQQKNYLLEKNIGDTIKIKGKVKSIGEVMGYSINIDEVE